MPEWEITTSVTRQAYYIVEADTAEAALEMFNDGELDSIDDEFIDEDVIEINETN